MDKNDQRKEAPLEHPTAHPEENAVSQRPAGDMAAGENEESAFTAPIPGDGINEDLERDPDFVQGKAMLQALPRIV